MIHHLMFSHKVKQHIFHQKSSAGYNATDGDNEGITKAIGIRG